MALGRRSISLHKKSNRQRSQCWRLLPFLATAACVAATRQQQQHKPTSLTNAKEAWTQPAFVPRQQWTVQQQHQGTSSSLCLNEFLLRFRGGSSDRNGDGGPSSYYNSNDYYQRGQPGQAGGPPPTPPSKGYDSYQGEGGGDDADDNDDRYYNDDYDYDDRGLDRPRRDKRSSSAAAATGKNNNNNNSFGAASSSILDSIPMPAIIKNGDRRIGFMLLSAGAVLTMLGISLFFNKALLRMGNLLFIAGVPMTLGPSRTAGYFLQAQKLRATACLGFGIFLVLIGSPVFGMILEVFGLLNLFGNMFPVLLAIAKTLPVIGPILSGGGGGGGGNSRRNNNNSRQGNNNNRRRQEEDDYYYQDDDQSYSNEGDGWRDDGGGSGDRYY